jgi:hypothetical protein
MSAAQAVRRGLVYGAVTARELARLPGTEAVDTHHRVPD